MPITGENPGVGTYKCTNCGTIAGLDDPDDTLLPCPKCNNTEFEEVCYLCENEASVSGESGMDANSVECKVCGKYYLGEPSELVRHYREEVPREKRAILSAYTRERFEHEGEPPVLGYPDKDIITDYENKTAGEKLKNLIWYIRKKSPQFGDSVSLEAEKDYPITYSLSPEGFTEILDDAIGQKLIESAESGFKLTKRGWTISTELMESKEGGQP